LKRLEQLYLDEKQKLKEQISIKLSNSGFTPASNKKPSIKLLKALTTQNESNKKIDMDDCDLTVRDLLKQ